MKQLNYLHLFTGLLAFVLVIAGITGLYQPSPMTFTSGNPTVPLLLMAALVNLLAAAYIRRRSGINRWLQIFGSLLLVSGMASAVVATDNNTLMIFGITLYQIAMFASSSGTLFHVLANMDVLFSPAPDFIDTSGRETGSVKWFNVSKGFGFITRDSGGDVFVHYRSIRGEGHRTLSEGQRVEFIVADKDKGLQAEDVIAAQKGR